MLWREHYKELSGSINAGEFLYWTIIRCSRWRYSDCSNIAIASLNPGRDLDVPNVVPCCFPALGQSIVQYLNLHFWNCGIHTSRDTIAACQDSLFVLFNINWWRIFSSRPQWPRRLRHELSSCAQTLGSWIRIPLKTWMSVCVYSVFVLFCT
jgi:hypothetical protein